MRAEISGPIGNDAYRGYLDDIHLSAANLLELLQGILEISDLQSARMDDSVELCSVFSLVQPIAD